MTLSKSDLKGPAKRLYEDWRSLGKTEAQALEEVSRSGLVEAIRGSGLTQQVSEADIDAEVARTFHTSVSAKAIISEADLDALIADTFGHPVREA